MDSRDTGGLCGEAGGSMEVTDECSSTGEIMGIEIRGVERHYVGTERWDWG